MKGIKFIKINDSYYFDPINKLIVSKHGYDVCISPFTSDLLSSHSLEDTVALLQGKKKRQSKSVQKHLKAQKKKPGRPVKKVK